MPAPDEDNLIMISALQHYSYCPRQYALIHLEQEFADNVHTNRGHAVHRVVDDPGSSAIKGMRVERALPLYSRRLGLVGKADVVEFHAGDIPYPVEYKHGSRRAKLHDEIQLAAQAVCLEEMTGKPVTQGALYYFGSRRRREVHITEKLKEQLEEVIAAIRAIMTSGISPSPVNDTRCNQCSLKDICQPEAVAATSKISAYHCHLFEPLE